MRHQAGIFLLVAIGLIIGAGCGGDGGGGGGGGTLGPVTVLGYSELGMHCMDEDFSELMILPPYNNLRAQVIARGYDEPRIISGNVQVTYTIPSNTHSADKTNFWDYVTDLLGVSLPSDVGLTGNGLSGILLPSGQNDWVVTGIPITPINDAGELDPYSLATISVIFDGTTLAETRVVVPVSWEISCDLCHTGGSSTANDILTTHDLIHGTTLASQTPVTCGDCHAQAALGKPGLPNVSSLSSAMHTAHAPRMEAFLPPTMTEDCYACHPGIQTKCFRDIHFMMGMSCESCHISMTAVGDPARRPWVDEPRCIDCHARAGFEFEQPGTLYRESKGHHGVHCAACHGSPHAIAPTVVAQDNVQAFELQGHSGTIDTCSVCHASPPDDFFSHTLHED